MGCTFSIGIELENTLLMTLFLSPGCVLWKAGGYIRKSHLKRTSVFVGKPLSRTLAIEPHSIKS